MAGEIVIELSAGTAHPRFPDFIYPLDYGYLEDTRASDGAQIDVWLGSGPRQVSAVVVTVDLLKRDSEIKLLVGCTPSQCEQILRVHNETGFMEKILLCRGYDREDRIKPPGITEKAVIPGGFCASEEHHMVSTLMVLVLPESPMVRPPVMIRMSPGTRLSACRVRFLAW